MKILIVDDSILVRSMLVSLLETIGGYEIVGQEANGADAIEAVKNLRPDLLIMDISMPVMDGIEATGIIMKEAPLPIIIFTGEDIESVGFHALNNGALEIISKPNIGQINNPVFAGEFDSILKNAYRLGQSKIMEKRVSPPVNHPLHLQSTRFKIVVVGASTGGPTAVRTVLEGIPKDFPLPIILTQHIEEGFDKGYAEWLNETSALTVEIAEHNIIPQKGFVYIAPANRHLVCHGGTLVLDDGPRVGNQKPSVDKMFISATLSYGPAVIGILLTGMGHDGAAGCLQIKKSGGETLVQNKETSMIFGMPKSAIEMGGATEVLPLTEIAPRLIERIAQTS